MRLPEDLYALTLAELAQLQRKATEEVAEIKRRMKVLRSELDAAELSYQTRSMELRQIDHAMQVVENKVFMRELGKTLLPKLRSDIALMLQRGTERIKQIAPTLSFIAEYPDIEQYLGRAVIPGTITEFYTTQSFRYRMSSYRHKDVTLHFIFTMQHKYYIAMNCSEALRNHLKRIFQTVQISDRRRYICNSNVIIFEIDATTQEIGLAPMVFLFDQTGNPVTGNEEHELVYFTPGDVNAFESLLTILAEILASSPIIANDEFVLNRGRPTKPVKF